MSEVGALLWWNRIEDAAALFWHEAAAAARVVTVDELGGACRIALTPPAGLRMTSLLPPDLSYLRHGNDAGLLQAALVRLLGGTTRLRVLAAHAIDSPALFEAALGAFQPDVVALRDGLDAPPWRRPATVTLSCGWTVRCAHDAAPVVQGWQGMFDERARRRRGVARRYRIDELASSGWPSPDPAAQWGRIPPGQRATLLLPGCHARAVRVRLSLVQPLAAEAVTQVLLDGAAGRLRCWPDRIEAGFDDVADVAAHRLEIAHDGPADLRVIAAEIAPAA